MSTATTEIDTTRSTLAINAFVLASRAAKKAREELTTAENTMKEHLADVIDQNGEGRAVYVDKVRAILTPRLSVSVSCLDQEAALVYWRNKGLKISTRTPEYVAPSSFRAEVLKNNVPDGLYGISETVEVNVI